MPPWQKILQKKLSGQKLDRNKLRGKKLNGKKIEQKVATKIRQRTRFFDRRYWAKYKFCGVPTQMGGCRFRRGQAGCQGGLRLVQQHHHHQLVHQHHHRQNHHHQHRKAGCQRRPASATTPTHTKVSSLQSGWLGNVEFYKRISFSSGWLPCRPTSSTTLNSYVAPNSFLIDISPRLVQRMLMFFFRIVLMYLICSVCLHLVFNPLNPFQGWVY